ncbi:MAG: hypothetical protein LUG57_05230 [Oscillospiraceae bacterium]|nr:hypothetical protein [Oscillospiraceae bacterium]
MKRNKKLTAVLAAALALVLALSGCSATTVEAYTVTGDTTETEAAELDFAAAYSYYDPDTVIFYVDGTGVTWQELFYEIMYYTAYVEYQEGSEITSWSDVCSLFTDSDGNYYTYGAVVLQNAITVLEQYHIVYDHLTAAGVTLGKDALDSIEALREQVIEESFDGDEDAFYEYLDSMYCTEELWNWFNEVDAMYAYDGFDTLYGEFGSDLSDEDVMAYAAGDEDGVWTQYVQIKQIYLYTEEETEEAEETEETEESEEIEETADAASEEASEETTAAETILAALDAAEDVDAAFDELYTQYNENADLDAYQSAGGWCLYEGDTEDEIYQAALELGDYEYTLVSIDGADVIVMSVPIDPDAGVYYDSSTGTMYTLRYYAAWQNYSDLINGDDGWIASAEADWAEGFESFSLTTIFAEAAAAAAETEDTTE